MFTTNIPLYYPNPLYGNATLRPYSLWAMYAGEEFFTFQVSTAEFRDTNTSYIPHVHFTWNRQSLFEPWMNMGTRAGGLNFNAQGRRLRKVSELHPVLLAELASTRCPLYRHAPSCVLRAPDVTSWTSFADNFASYISGDVEFPVAVSKERWACSG